MTSAATVIERERQARQAAYTAFLPAIAQAAREGPKRLKKVVDDYEYDSSRYSAGPRKATALISLRVRVECSFVLPASAIPEDCELRIDTSRGYGCWLGRPGIDDEDPDDVMRLAFEDQEQLLCELVMEGLMGNYTFESLAGFDELSKRYRAEDFVYRVDEAGVMVSFVAEMEAY